MRSFNELCKQFEEMNVATYSLALTEKSLKILPVLSAIMQDNLDGITIYSSFILGAVVADGKVTEEEYLLIRPTLRIFFGESIDYETCKTMLRKYRKEGRELKRIVNLMVDVFGELSDELKEDIILVCMMICAADGKISLSEKAWIKQLIR